MDEPLIDEEGTGGMLTLDALSVLSMESSTTRPMDRSNARRVRRLIERSKA